MTIRFKSDYSQTIDGFWFPEDAREAERDAKGVPTKIIKEGDTVKGILVDYARNSEYPFYVLEIVEDQDSCSLKVQDERGETMADLQYGVTKGARVALSNWAEFKGLEKYIGHHIDIAFAGYQSLSKNREKRLFDIEISDKPVPGRARTRESRRNGVPSRA